MYLRLQSHSTQRASTKCFKCKFDWAIWIVKCWVRFLCLIKQTCCSFIPCKSQVKQKKYLILLCLSNVRFENRECVQNIKEMFCLRLYSELGRNCVRSKVNVHIWCFLLKFLHLANSRTFSDLCLYDINCIVLCVKKHIRNKSYSHQSQGCCWSDHD